jgi:hypothetical protein
MRSNLCHDGKKAKLYASVREPAFLTDPAHRVKVMVKGIFAKVAKNKNVNMNTIKNVDAMMIKKYTSCYVMQNRTGDFKRFVANAVASVEHLFNEHSFCDAAWCWNKEISEKSKERMEIRMKKMKILPNNETRNTNSDESDRDCDSDVVYRDIETAAVLGLCSLATPTITVEDEIDRISETDDDDSSYATADEDDSCSSDDEYDDVDAGACEVVEDILEENKVTSTLEDYDDGQLVLTVADMKLWKTKEKALAERYKSGYYRCKVKYAEVYE